MSREDFHKDDNRFRPDARLDPELQRELDEALGELSLDDILAAEEAAETGSAGASEVRTGRVIAVQGDDIFVDLGGKSQGILPAQQFRGEDLPAEGDLVQFIIDGYDEADGLLLLNREGAITAAAWETIQTGDLVIGRVTGHNKGGLELDIQGIPGFMPISQVDRFRVEDLGPYLNERLECRVVEVRRGEGSVVVSRRELLEEQAAEARKQAFESLEEGLVVQGVVRTVMPYGAFVDIGGVDGLLHVGDMSYARVEDPATIVQEGMKVQVRILKVDREERRISLGLKQVQPDPWDGAEEKWPANTVVMGRVSRLAPFGAFVELTPGVEGLIPLSELSFDQRVRRAEEAVKVGDAVHVLVLNVDIQRRRIGLSLKRAGDDPWVGATVRWPVGEVAEGIVTRLADFGAFVELVPGVEGLVHVSELADGFVRSPGAVVREGDTVRAKVLSVDEEARRISLSVKQLATATGYAGADEPAAAPAARKRKRPLKGGLD